ncbi:hypothetical protein BDP55DRAFT_720095 [Colletotrichum godetiae]|uniref:Uncharacterized protein n=1 Tax=Colletotrichum godetiae TaxID=1209918 RepID=A0AAJ0ADY1_9PEZI|nr:uncharacterized protein BDP55DRAFT_720095 [Colletotrichum godetiae]KAK1659185.1 hypothetical protein BDP55DRAFT_720095 [Colletotrichum godetiae]
MDRTLGALCYLHSATSLNARDNFECREESQDIKERLARVYLARARTSIKPSHAAFQPQTKSHPLIPPYSKSPNPYEAQDAAVSCQISYTNPIVEGVGLCFDGELVSPQLTGPHPPNAPSGDPETLQLPKADTSQTMGFSRFDILAPGLAATNVCQVET